MICEVEGQHTLGAVAANLDALGSRPGECSPLPTRDRSHDPPPPRKGRRSVDRQVQESVIVHRLDRDGGTDCKIARREAAPECAQPPVIRISLPDAAIEKPVVVDRPRCGRVLEECAGPPDVTISLEGLHFVHSTHMDRHHTARRIAGVLLISLAALGGCQGVRSTEDSIRLGNHYLEFGDWKQASDAFAGVVERSPGNWQAEYGYGVAQANLGDLATARRCLETANDRSPGNMQVIDALASVLGAQGDTKRMYQLLNGAGASLGSPEPYLALAKYAEALKDDDSALTALRAAIEVDAGVVQPRTVMPYLQLALLQQRLGNQPDAIRRLRQAYGISPNDPRVRQALMAAGIPTDAQTALPPGL